MQLGVASRDALWHRKVYTQGISKRQALFIPKVYAVDSTGFGAYTPRLFAQVFILDSLNSGESLMNRRAAILQRIQAGVGLLSDRDLERVVSLVEGLTSDRSSGQQVRVDRHGGDLVSRTDGTRDQAVLDQEMDLAGDQEK